MANVLEKTLKVKATLIFRRIMRSMRLAKIITIQLKITAIEYSNGVQYQKSGEICCDPGLSVRILILKLLATSILK